MGERKPQIVSMVPSDPAGANFGHCAVCGRGVCNCPVCVQFKGARDVCTEHKPIKAPPAPGAVIAPKPAPR